jgi:hypothetical protein
MFKLKRATLAVLAAIVLALGIAAGTGAAAHAATPSCGPGCIDIFSWQFGNFANPAFSLDTLKQGEKVGQPQILFRVSNSDPALDYNAEFDGFTSDFYAAGLVSSAVAMHWGCLTGAITQNSQQIACSPGYTNDPAGEIEYSPYGVASGLCVGLASDAFQGEGVTLQPCGETARTVWIVDTVDQLKITAAGLPLINGSDENFSHPFVLTYPANKFPTDKPRTELTVTNLTGFTQPGGIFPVLGTVDSSQLWSAILGVLP